MQKKSKTNTSHLRWKVKKKISHTTVNNEATEK